ncbi:unnamed protein product, partial [Staurois parvus]
APFQNQNNISSNTHQTEHVQSDSTRYVLSGDKRGTLEEGEIREVRNKQRFYTMQRINPLGSTVSITSMFYCQGRTDNSWGPRAIGDHGAPVSLPKLKKASQKESYICGGKNDIYLIYVQHCMTAQLSVKVTQRRIAKKKGAPWQ